MKKLWRNLAEAVTFAIVMTIVAWFDGGIVSEGALRPLWLQIAARLLIYMAIFFAVSLIIDAIVAKLGKKK